ncbi:hypothetical protein EJ08DRAFT_700023 [Tothia fuscella]|uniref:Thioesterase domain-containing protein n=1 Tax=Tothia fuscella TaxID=1048955 RepID=A0A9P4NKV2_9PEZI|nr:hypothetical protein EJ08DRAFT_700023 [Tothia fuscella]
MTQELTHFRSIPWCNALISDHAYFLTPSRSRYVKPSGEDVLLGNTIKTDDTIKAWLTLCKKPTSSGLLPAELRTLLTFGRALDGYPQILHGGIQGTVMDEVMGNLIGLIQDIESEEARKKGESYETAPWVTGELTLRYKRPVVTPGTVCCHVWVVKRDGRKVWIDGAIEDEKGVTLAGASGLFIKPRTQKI